jgi:hypothetical protein
MGDKPNDSIPIAFEKRLYDPRNILIATQKVLNYFGTDSGGGAKFLKFLGEKIGKSSSEGDFFIAQLEKVLKGVELTAKGIILVPAVIWVIAKYTVTERIKAGKLRAENEANALAEEEARLTAEAERIKQAIEFMENQNETRIVLPHQAALISEAFKADNIADPLVLDVLTSENLYSWLDIKPENGGDPAAIDAAITTRRANTTAIDTAINGLTTDLVNKSEVEKKLNSIYTYLSVPTAVNPLGLTAAEKTSVKTALGFTGDIDPNDMKVIQLRADIGRIIKLSQEMPDAGYNWADIMQKLTEIVTVAERLKNNAPALKKYNEIWLVGATHTITPLNSELGRGTNIPVDIREQFKDGGIIEGDNPFLLLGFMGAPDNITVIDNRIAELKNLYNSVPNTPADIQAFKDKIGNIRTLGYPEEEIEGSLNYLSTIDRKDVEILNGITNIFQQIIGGAVPINISINNTPITINDPAIINQFKDVLLRKDPATGLHIMDRPMRVDKAALDILIANPGLAGNPNLAEFIEEALNLTNKTPQINQYIFDSEFGPLNFMNDLQPYFELIFHNFDGNLQAKPIWGLLDPAHTEDILNKMREKANLKVLIAARLKAAFGTPNYDALVGAHKNHLLKILNGDITVLNNLPGEVRDPGEFINDLKEYIARAETSPAYQQLLADRGISINKDKINAPRVNKSIAITSMEQFSQVADLRNELQKVGRVILFRLDDLISRHPGDLGSAPQDVQDSIIELNRFLQTLVAIGFNTNTLEINEKTFKMYLNGLLTYPASMSSQNIMQCLGDSQFRYNFNFNKGGNKI